MSSPLPPVAVNTITGTARDLRLTSALIGRKNLVIPRATPAIMARRSAAANGPLVYRKPNPYRRAA